jgi:ribosomal protein L13
VSRHRYVTDGDGVPFGRPVTDVAKRVGDRTEQNLGEYLVVAVNDEVVVAKIVGAITAGRLTVSHAGPVRLEDLCRNPARGAAAAKP